LAYHDNHDTQRPVVGKKLIGDLLYSEIARFFVVCKENSVQFENAEVTIIREMMVASTMNSVLGALFAFLASSFRARATLQAEILALRQQLAVLHKNAPPRLRLQRSDRWLWVLLSRCCSGWRPSLLIVQPPTVVRLAPESLYLV